MRTHIAPTTASRRTLPTRLACLGLVLGAWLAPGHDARAAEVPTPPGVHRFDRAAVIDPVWQLLEHAYRHFGVIPTVLERDFNIPPLATLLDEVNTIHMLQAKYQHPVDALTQHG